MSISSFFSNVGSTIKDVGLSFAMGGGAGAGGALSTQPQTQSVVSSAPLQSGFIGGVSSAVGDTINTVSANVAGANKAVAVANRSPLIGLYDRSANVAGTIWDKAKTSTTDLFNVFNVGKNVNGVKGKVTNAVTGFASQTSKTVSEWLSEATSELLTSASGALTHKLFPTDRPVEHIPDRLIPSMAVPSDILGFLSLSSKNF